MNSSNKKQSVLISFWSFIKNPKYEVDYLKKKTRSKAWDVLRLWALVLVISLLAGIVISIALFISKYDMEKHAIVDLMKNGPIYVIIIFGIVWAPIAEELTFRMSMKYSPFKLSFTLGFILILITDLISKIFPGFLAIMPDWFFDMTGVDGALSYLAFIVVFGLVAGFIFKKKVSASKMADFYSKRFFIIFYSVTFVFALLHLLNFDNIKQIWFLAPFLIFPQFILGLTLGFVRMKYGLKWSIVNHILHNGLLMAPMLLMTLLSAEVTEAFEQQNLSVLENIGSRDLMILSIIGWGAIIFAIFILTLLIHLIWEAVKKD